METIVSTLNTMAPFVAPYPWWVKTALVVFVISGAILLLGLILASPDKKPAAPTPTAESPAVTHSVTSHDQKGGVTGHTVNIGTPKE
jgi:hypothetical protein